MVNGQEGFRRLGLAFGSVAATIYLFANLILIESLIGSAASVNPFWIPVLLVGTAVIWCAGWGLVRVAWWVWKGFTFPSSR